MCRHLYQFTLTLFLCYNPQNTIYICSQMMSIEIMLSCGSMRGNQHKLYIQFQIQTYLCALYRKPKHSFLILVIFYRISFGESTAFPIKINESLFLSHVSTLVRWRRLESRIHFYLVQRRLHTFAHIIFSATFVSGVFNTCVSWRHHEIEKRPPRRDAFEFLAVLFGTDHNHIIKSRMYEWLTLPAAA